MGERDVREVLKRLRFEAWSEEPGKGSHRIFRKEGMPNISIPTSAKELKRGLYESIAKKAGWK